MLLEARAHFFRACLCSQSLLPAQLVVFALKVSISLLLPGKELQIKLLLPGTGRLLESLLEVMLRRGWPLAFLGKLSANVLGTSGQFQHQYPTQTV